MHQHLGLRHGPAQLVERAAVHVGEVALQDLARRHVGQQLARRDAGCICSASKRQYQGLAVVRPCRRSSATMPLKLVPRPTSMLCCCEDTFSGLALKRW
jgi:hypothetical protein